MSPRPRPLPAPRPHRAPVVRFAASLLVLCVVACDERPDDAARVYHMFGSAGMGRGEFNYPRGMAISPVDGCVFAVDKSARIQRFDPQGRYETEWRMPEWDNGKPTNLHVDRRNRVWVPDTHYSRVIVYDRDGRELFRFGTNGTGPGQFIWPTSLITDEQGNTYVGEFGGNDRISKFAPPASDTRGESPTYLFSFAHGEPETGGTSRPQGMAFDDEGILWVADAANHRLSRFTREGKYLGSLGQMGEGPGQFHYPYHLAIRPDRSLLVCDYGNNRIERLDRNGKMLDSWGSVGRMKGQICHPWSLDLSKDGSVYVLDSWNNRVQVVKW